jgi:murein DD-endopeptidase MepM/ murein hydrolase activator NlpD
VAILWPNGLTTPPAVSSPYGPRGSGAYGDASTWHLGVDLVGYDTIHAIADGEVVFVGWYSELGWKPVAGFMVWVMHDGFLSRSLHTDSATPRVSVGDRVRAGDPLIDTGYSGLTDGAGNPAPWRKHHHLEIVITDRWHAGNYGQVDPYAWLSEHVGGESTTGGGGTAAASTKGDLMEAYVLAPDGTVVHLRAGGKTNFKSPEQYAGRQALVKKLRAAGATNLVTPPTLKKVPSVTWALFEELCDAIGAPKG